MPRDIVPIVVTRTVRTRTATAGYTTATVAVTGSPFQCRVFRVKQTGVDRQELSPATATIDSMVVISFLDTSAGVQIGDIATLPDGRAAKLLRARKYSRTFQWDTEIGVE